MEIRRGRKEEVDAIRTVTAAAFQNAPYSHQTEAAIVDALRKADALTLSLVAVDDGILVGHLAISAVTINGEAVGWYGLGPVSVRPDRQRQGIGQSLIRTGLDYLKDSRAQGCVVPGDPDYYGRFGFVSDPDLLYGSAPPEYFQRLAFGDAAPTGEVSYHPGFHAV